MPVPTPETAPLAAEGWTYSYDATAPVVDPLGSSALEVTEPPPAYELLEAEPAPAYDTLLPVASVPMQAVEAATVPAPAAFAPAVVSYEGPSTPLLVAESEAEESAYSRGSTETAVEGEEINLHDLLMTVLDRGASDLHLTAGARPTLRINGALVQLDDQPLLAPPVIQRVMYAALTQKQREKFEENL